ncbi:MAG: hypothetical protein E7Z84_09125 [Methanosphaera stadtmanae]|nr:hypothetical protein [Methanosphaera stadtmanae]
MDIKKILLISIIAVAILASFTVVSAGLFDDLFNTEQPDNIVKVDNVKFNFTNESNVTKFKLENESKGDEGYVKYYFDENGDGYNIWIANVSKADDSQWNQVVNQFDESLDNEPCETIDGVVVYTQSAGHGEHVGEPRFMSYTINHDLKTIVKFSTPTTNDTVKMKLSLDFN